MTSLQLHKKMLSQKLSRIALKMSDLEEYEKSRSKMDTSSSAAVIKTPQSGRKPAAAPQTPAALRSSTPQPPVASSS